MDEWDELESRYKPKGNYKMHDENKNALLNNYVVHQNVLVYYKGVPSKKNLKKFMSLVEK